MLMISVACAAPTSFSGVVQAQPLTLHLVIDSEDIDAHSEIASSIETELAKIGIDVIIDPRDKATLASTVWGSEWDKTWDEEPGNGWDMVWYEFPHPKLWALIISGSTGGSFSNNTEYMYHVLSQSYNFDGIYYLDVDTSRPGVNASATKDNVRQAILGVATNW